MILCCFCIICIQCIIVVKLLWQPALMSKFTEDLQLNKSRADGKDHSVTVPGAGIGYLLCFVLHIFLLILWSCRLD